MGFTLKSSYALRALYELAIAAENGEDKLSLVEIVNRTPIPRDFLEKIFGELRQAGIVRAIRGRYGGYGLKIPPEKISVRDVIMKLDNPLNSFECVQREGKCLRTDECTVKYVWFKLYNAMMRELGDMSLTDLMKLGRSIEDNPPDVLRVKSD